MLHSQGWEIYRSLMAGVEADLLEGVLKRTKEEFDFERGRVYGLRLALQFPQDYLAKMAQVK